MHDKIQFVTITIDGESVKVTSAFHVRSVINEVNDKSILTSSFYYDIQNNLKYLQGDKYSFPNFDRTHPKQYKNAVKKLKRMGVVKRPSHVFLTEAGVSNLLHAYNIDLETLMQGGPKIPTVQNSLFGKATPDKKDVSDSVITARKLFPPKGHKKRARALSGRRVRLTQPGITIHGPNEERLINLSKALMPMLHEVPYIDESVQHSTFVRADINIAEIDGRCLLGIHFNSDGDHTLHAHRRVIEGRYYLQNIGYRVRSTNPRKNPVWLLMQENDLFGRSFINPELGGDVLMFDIGEE